MRKLIKNSNKINWGGFEMEGFIYMFRYCLSRKSYSVGTAIGIIQANWNILSEFDKKLIHKEIIEHFDLYSSDGKYDMDRTFWDTILELPIEDKG